MAIITISRGSLSGGRALAECLANRLGYPMVGREVFQEAAEAFGSSEEVMRAKFEAPPGIWARFTHERETYILAVQTSLAEWCTRGNLIYHGLAGQFLLRGLRGVLRVRIIAPLEKRIKNLQETHSNMTRAQARALIRNVDNERARWVKVMYGNQILDPNLYDLTVNLRRHTVESACATIAEAASHSQFQITDEVEEELFAFAAQCRGRLKNATRS